VGDTPGENQVSIRGLSTGPRNPLFEQAVTIQVDGIVSARASQFVLPFFDVERVEVLRGPQGVLFGKNATAGAINIVTANPTPQFSGTAAARYEFENQGWGLEGVVAGPISATLGGRLALKVENEGGYIDDLNLGKEHGEQETIAARATLEWRPSEALRVRLKLDGGQSDRIGNVQQIGACTTNLAFVRAVSPQEDCSVNDRTAHSFLGGTFTDSGAASLNVDYDVGGLTLTSISGVSAYHSILERDLDMTPANAIQRLRDERYQQYSQEFRLTSPAEQRLSYIAGAFFQSQRIDIDDRQDLNVLVRPYTNATTAAFNPALNVRTLKIADQLQTLWSAYAQLTFEATDRLRLIGGARYTDETKQVSYDLLRFLWGTNERRVTPLDISIRDRERQEANFDPQFGVQYDITDRLMSYVTASVVHKAGGFNIEETNGQQVARTFEYDQEEARSIEAGLKAQLRRGLLTLAVFNTDFSDLQVSSFDGVTVFVRNAAEARSRGVELDGRLRLTEFLTARAALAYLDAKFTDYPGGTCTTTEAARVAPAPCTRNLSGARLTFAPEWSGNLSLDAEWPLRAGYMGQAGATMTYKGEHFTQENNDPFFVLPATTRIDAYAGLELDDGRWTLRLLAKNIGDEMPPTFAFPIRGHIGSFGASTPRGREIFLETRIRW
jgi:iron complex outermembrane receptor protein